jgi:hypothetical protein
MGGLGIPADLERVWREELLVLIRTRGGEKKSYISALELWRGLPDARMHDNKHAEAMGELMRELGYKKWKMRLNGTRGMYWMTDECREELIRQQAEWSNSWRKDR